MAFGGHSNNVSALFGYYWPWVDAGSDVTSEFTTGPDTIQILNLKINQIDHFTISDNAHTDHPEST